MKNDNMTNELIKEKSPYLLQHAFNPVNWYPWNEAAFETAKRKDVPIFLSIGYSTCHWCHVIAHESFEDIEVAEFLNQHFVSIKVDREERPDIDAIYMEACISLTGSGGWPLSVFLNHDKEPFWVGTYFPKALFLNLLKQINQLWEKNRNQINENALRITEYLKLEEEKTVESFDYRLPKEVFLSLASNFDLDEGGLKYGPKFPAPHHWLFLLRYHQVKKSRKALEMVEKTLIKMRKGGIFDQIGYGFCRYATDSKWLVPHFEKMLYDNAWLMIVYIETYKVIRKPFFLQTAIEISSYLTERMRSPWGGYYTAEDADSEGEEGAFYLFSEQELDSVLGKESQIFKELFNVTPKGNFQGKNILHIGENILPAEPWVKEEIDKVKRYQSKRKRPFRDEKILSSYNGLTMAAFALLYQVTQEEKYLEYAKEIASFLQNKMIKGNTLYTCFIKGSQVSNGFDEDYAYVIRGFLALYEACLEKAYLDLAVKLMDEFLNRFYDYERGGFFQTAIDHETIIKRRKQFSDGAIPSPNSVAIENLLRLKHITNQKHFYEYALQSLKFFQTACFDQLLGGSYFALNYLYLENGGTNAVLSGKTTEEVIPFLKAIHNSSLPFVTVSFDPEKQYEKLDNAPTVYLCQNKHCLPPIDTLYELERVLASE